MPDFRDVLQAQAQLAQTTGRRHTELLRNTTPCDECRATPADPAPFMTGRPDGVLCERCWWRLNMRGAR